VTPLARADRALGWLENAFIGVALAVTSVLLFVNVVLRYVFHAPLAWAEELTMYAMVWIVFVGGSVVVRTRGHIAVDVLPLMLSRAGNRALAAAVRVAGLVFLAVFVWYSLEHTLRVRASGQVMPAMLAPMWLAYLAMPVGGALMTMRMLQGLVRMLSGGDDGRPSIDLLD
jgi:C4-dicarboxylate transporter, DctQ subunit